MCTLFFCLFRLLINQSYCIFDITKQNQQNKQLAQNDESYSSIRITPYYDEIESILSQSDLEYIKSIVGSAIRYAQSFLKIIPINGTFHIPRECLIHYTINGYDNCVYYGTPHCGLGISFFFCCVLQLH